MKTKIIIILFFVISNLFAYKTFSVSGFNKIYFIFADLKEENNKRNLFGNNLFSVQLRYRPNRFIDIRTDYNLSFWIKNKQENIFSNAFNQYRIGDFDRKLFSKKKDSSIYFTIIQNFNKLYIKLKPKLADIIIGRQLISMGTSRFISPMDFITPFGFNAIDSENKPGVDAIRIKIPTGMMNEIDLGYIFGEDFKFENSAVYLRNKLYISQTDFEILTAIFKNNLIVGFAMARSLFKSTFWLETSYILYKIDNIYKIDNENNSFAISSGFDYVFRGNIYTSIGYYYNNSGETNPENYVINLSKKAYTVGNIYLLAKQYLNINTNFQITPLITLSNNNMFNANDLSTYTMLTCMYNVKENLYLNAGVSFCIKENYNNNIKTEFENYLNIFYTNINYYF